MRRLGPTKELFTRGGGKASRPEVDWAGFERLMRTIYRGSMACWCVGVFKRGPKPRAGGSNPLFNRRAWLWTFKKAVGVEPTNKASGRYGWQ